MTTAAQAKHALDAFRQRQLAGGMAPGTALDRTLRRLADMRDTNQITATVHAEVRDLLRLAPKAGRPAPGTIRAQAPAPRPATPARPAPKPAQPVQSTPPRPAAAQPATPASSTAADGGAAPRKSRSWPPPGTSIGANGQVIPDKPADKPASVHPKKRKSTSFPAPGDSIDLSPAAGSGSGGNGKVDYTRRRPKGQTP